MQVRDREERLNTKVAEVCVDEGAAQREDGGVRLMMRVMKKPVWR